MTLSVVLASSVVGGGAMFVMTPSAFAQTTAVALNADQLATLKASLTTEVQAAHGDAQAVINAIAYTIISAIGQYGSGSAGSVASAILADAEALGLPADEIGAGLAHASAQLAATDSAAAQAIATTMANEGNAQEIASYQSTATALGYANLASIAGQGATPIAEIPTNTTQNNNQFSSGGGGQGAASNTCLVPSCTKL